jgi:ribose transport system permease protein
MPALKRGAHLANYLNVGGHTERPGQPGHADNASQPGHAEEETGTEQNTRGETTRWPRTPVFAGLHHLRSWGLPIAFAVMVLVFCLLLPHFATIGNAKNILAQQALVAVLAAGVTVILVIGEFDFSFAGVVGLSGLVAVLMMSQLHMGAAAAVVAAVGVGLCAGCLNGMLVAYGRAPSFIATLAVGAIASGVEEGVSGSNTIYAGIDQSYLNLMETDTVLGIPLIIVCSLAVVAAVWVVLRFTTFGRRAYAVGGNEPAAHLAGIRTHRVRFLGFVITGLCAGLVGIILTSRSGAYFPQSTFGLLISAYAGAFLGVTATRGRQFHPWSSYLGVLFLGTLSTGLVEANWPAWTSDLVTGVVLVTAVLIARRT